MSEFVWSDFKDKAVARIEADAREGAVYPSDTIDLCADLRAALAELARRDQQSIDAMTAMVMLQDQEADKTRMRATPPTPTPVAAGEPRAELEAVPAMWGLEDLVRCSCSHFRGHHLYTFPGAKECLVGGCGCEFFAAPAPAAGPGKLTRNESTPEKAEWWRKVGEAAASAPTLTVAEPAAGPTDASLLADLIHELEYHGRRLHEDQCFGEVRHRAEMAEAILKWAVSNATALSALQAKR